MTKYILTKNEIDDYKGLKKTHFLNTKAKRLNKSLGDLVGLKGIGFHIIEVEPGHESTEFHIHHFEDECAYILEGVATIRIGSEEQQVRAGDFIGYPAGGPAHTMYNHGDSALKCIVVGQRLQHDITDYPDLDKRLYRNGGKSDLVDLANVTSPTVGKKA